jgi:hypothetical protein
MGHVVVEILWMMYGFLLQILHKWKSICTRIKTTIELVVEY